jgi:RNA polymerase sigma factor (TIGR02999 family)
MSPALHLETEPSPRTVSRIFLESYDDLRRIAHARVRRYNSPPTLLETTAIVHECYLRFLKSGRIRVADRAHFLSYSAHVMRSVVVDVFRERCSERHGGGSRRVPFDERVVRPASQQPSDVLRIHDALEYLSTFSVRLVRVVELRYFAGLDESEIGEILGITERTVRRDWDKARIILAAALR